MNTINNLIKDTVAIMDSATNGYGAGIVAFNYGYTIDEAMAQGVIQLEERGDYAMRYCISARGLERANELGYLGYYDAWALELELELSPIAIESLADEFFALYMTTRKYEHLESYRFWNKVWAMSV